MNEMEFRRVDGVAILTVNRPAQRNAMTWAMYDRLVDLCDEVDEDDQILTWVIRGAGGKAFISGTDIRQFTAFRGNAQAGIEYVAKIDRVLRRLDSVKKPMIAEIDGFVMGGGLMIALHCDIRLASTESKFVVPCVRLGNCLSMSNYAKLLQLIGPARTLELVLTGREVDADEAQRMGLVSGVGPPPEIRERVNELARGIARSAPITCRVTKEAIRRLQTKPTAPGDDLIQSCYASIDFQEGVAAFLEKRSPIWRGR